MAFKKSVSTDTKINYEVIENYGSLSTNGEWVTELRFVSWNGREPKYDIRAWKATETGEMCGKGITLTGEEMENLLNILKQMETEN